MSNVLKRRVATPSPTLTGRWVVDFRWAEDGLHTQIVALRETRGADNGRHLDVAGGLAGEERDHSRWACGLSVTGTRRGEVARLVLRSGGDFVDMGVDVALGRSRRTWSGWWHVGATHSEETREGRVEFRRPPDC